jgi:putative peptidoglycan lipid II flippase
LDDPFSMRIPEGIITPMPSSDTARTATRQIARGAVVVILAYLVTTPIRLLSTILTARIFGTGAASEAFFASNRFAEILFNLVAGGALGSAFIPTFTGLLAKKDRATAWKLASAITNLVLLVLSLLSLLAIIFARQVVHYILAPGFSLVDPAKEALAAELLRIQLPSALVFGLSGLFMGILNAHQHFLLPALAPAMYTLGWIFGLLVLVPSLGIHGLAWGVLCGAVLHMLIQLPMVFKLPGRRFSLTLGLKTQPVRAVLVLMLPRLLGVAVVQLNFLLNTFLASLQPEGSVTAITLAWTVMLMPQAAIAQSIATAALPTFSAQAARGRLEQMRSSLAATLRGVLLLAIPTSFGLILLRQPLVQLLFQQGSAFNDRSTQMVTWALLWYGAGLVGHCIVEIISRAFYALQDTRTPVMVGIAAMSMNLVFSLAFSALFRSIGWLPHGGLALANSLATAIECFILLAIMRTRLQGLEGKSVLILVSKAMLAALLMSIAISVWMTNTAQESSIIVALGGILVGAVVYGLVVFFSRVQEISTLWFSLRRKLHF